MGYKIYEREYHNRRKAKNMLNYRHFYESHNWIHGLHRDYAEHFNGCGYKSTFKGYVRFHRYDYTRVCNNINNPNLVSLDLTFDDIDFWEAERLEMADRLLTAKRWVDKGSIIGYGKSKKWLRTKYHAERRVRELRAIHKIMRDEDDWENINLDIDRGAIWWDIF